MFGRRRRLPAGMRPRLDADERVLAWAVAAEAAVGEAAGTAAGRPAAVVATNAGLFLPGRPGRLGWHEIHKVSWDGATLGVIPGEVVDQRPGYLVTADRSPVMVALTRPGDLPRVVRARVTRSVSYSSHHRLPAGGVLVVARRVPGRDGLSWAVRYDPGTDPADPAVRTATDQLVAGLAEAAEPPH